MKIQDILAENLNALTPDTVISLFHASSDPSTIKKFLIQGVDGRMPVNRKYPHYVTNEAGERVLVNRGVFVTADLQTAMKFGSYAIKFRTRAENLYSIFPQKSNVSNEREAYGGRFPRSFRPEVSAYLTGAAWGNEPQALFRGFVSPRAIEAVYKSSGQYGQGQWVKMTVEEFLAHEAEGTSHVSTPFVDPTNLSQTDFSDVISNMKSRYKHLGDDEIIDIVSSQIKRADTYEAQIKVMGDLTKTSYSVAKVLTRQFLQMTGIEQKPSVGTKQIYHGF